MFKRKKCTNCGNSVGKNHSFCPYCGDKIGKNKSDDSDYGLLGRDDFEDNLHLPFGFNMLIKPLMKELTRQMAELDKEIKQENNKMPSNFSIRISGPGIKPIRMTNSAPVKQVIKKPVANTLPKFSLDVLNKIKNFPREEAKSEMRRLSDRVVYEISVPGIKSMVDVNINKLEGSYEVKVIGEGKVYFKNIEIDLPFIGCYSQQGKLILEFQLK